MPVLFPRPNKKMKDECVLCGKKRPKSYSVGCQDCACDICQDCYDNPNMMIPCPNKSCDYRYCVPDEHCIKVQKNCCMYCNPDASDVH